MWFIKRYSKVYSKYPREVVLLNSVGGCSWAKCSFCDYYTAFSANFPECGEFNKRFLANIDGEFGVLQVINSASFSEFPLATVFDIRDICANTHIKTLITEQHFLFAGENRRIAEFFSNTGTTVKFICGVETFDEDFRERVLIKGMQRVSPEMIAESFQWVNLLFGVKDIRGGRDPLERLQSDLDIAYNLFERINICVFGENTTNAKRDGEAVERFYNSDFFNSIKDDPRTDPLS
ncbi:radical SAM protein [Clostridia bacterium]|nr:radical SAM protein [Clostridia bacterium]